MKKLFLSLLVGFVVVAPNYGFAKTVSKPFLYEAWVPYWRQSGGVQEATDKLAQFQELSPFAYEVDATGFVADKIKMTADPWVSLSSASQSKKVKIIPTVFWGYGTQIYNVLSNKTKRAAHVSFISDMVNMNGFDGIDIDYEDRTSATKPYFSAFIKELGAKLHASGKELVCTVGPRVPLASRSASYQESAKDGGEQFATDFKVINKYCDEVRVMAYDQGAIDAKLDNEKASSTSPYLPIADVDWVRKAIAQTLNYVSKSKFVLGIPTYGYSYKMNSAGNYVRVGSLGYSDLVKLEAQYGNATRNSAGELQLAYTDSSGAKRLVVVSDSYAVDQKILLAQAYGLRGVALFKLDGTNDPNLWAYIGNSTLARNK